MRTAPSRRSRTASRIVPLLLVGGCASAPDASAVTRDELVEPRTEAGPAPEGFDSKDYIATNVTFRLFGVELGDGTVPKSAIVADTRDWSTRVVHEGDLLGRSYRVARLEATGITLERNRGEPLLVRPGADARVRVVWHRLDVVTRPLGRGKYAIDARAARARDASLPTSERDDLDGTPVLRLTHVVSGSLLAEAGLRDGDVLVGAGDARVTDSTLADLVRALREPGATTTVRLLRNGVPITLTFTVSGDPHP